MQLIIDIPDKVYKDIQRKSLEIQIDGDTLENAILNGTPLPKEPCETVEYEKDLNKLKEQILKDGNTLVTKQDLLERFVSVNEERKNSPWNLLQILANIDILIGEEPCEDTISRQAVLDNAYAYGNGLEPEGYCVNVEDIQALPPVILTQKWIPCSEKLPKKSGKYWCTFGETYNMGVDSYCTKEDAEETYEEPEEYVGWTSKNVIAWMPAPKPYKTE